MKHGFLLFILAALRLPVVAQDMPLSQVLLDEEDWELVSEGFKFTDGPCVDKYGHFYFTGSTDDTSHVYRINPDGKLSILHKTQAFASGSQIGPDGRWYFCRIRDNQVVALNQSGQETVIASLEKPNDLVVTKSGDIYVTQTGKSQVSHVSMKGEVTVMDIGIPRPNGITLSADQGTLAVSDSQGPHIWTFRIENDGRLSHRERYMTMRMPSQGGRSRGDGMTTDAAGRYYVTTAEGIQMFDPTGRISGVISKPSRHEGVTNIVFAGHERKYLYVTSGGRIYRRLTQAKGAIFFE